MSTLMRYLELVLTAVGLLICLGVIALIPDARADKWFVVAVVAIVIGVVHGLIFFVVRERERRVREAAIEDVRAMLTDRVRNLMTVVAAYGGSDEPAQVDQAEAARASILRLVDTLSEDALRRWRAHYAAFEARDAEYRRTVGAG
jgi:Na+/melibiose symporter-like transporter